MTSMVDRLEVAGPWQYDLQAAPDRLYRREAARSSNYIRYVSYQ
jgi:hypothetical protein